MANGPVMYDTSTWRGRLLPATLIYVGLVVAVVSSVGAPLIPSIAVDYGVAVSSAQWSLTIAFLVGAVSGPVIGRIADGPRRIPVLVGSLSLMVLGSVISALPGSFALLIAGRALQGAGLSLAPVAMSVARDHLDPRRARSTMATLAVTAVVGVGLGYPLTGLIADQWGLHACFWAAAVFGAVALIMSVLIIPGSGYRASQPFDLGGAILMALGLSGLLLCISQGETWGWGSPKLLGLAAASIVVLGAWSAHQLRAAAPLVDLRLNRLRSVLTANVIAVIGGTVMYMIMSMVSRYVQTPTAAGYGLGASVIVAGFVLTPMSIASFGASRLSTWAGRWIPPWRMLPVGAVMFACALGLFAVQRSELWMFFVVMFLVGLGVGTSFAVMPRMIMEDVPADATSSALAANQVLRNVGFSIGSAFSAAILAASTVAPDPLPTDAGYTVGALIGVALCIVMAAVAILLAPRRRGALTDAQEARIEEVAEEEAEAGIAGGGAFVADPAPTRGAS